MRTTLSASSLRRFLLLLLAVSCSIGTGGIARAAAENGPNTTIPVEKDRNRHDGFLTIAKAGGVDLLFLGDSITDGWRGGGLTVWDKYFAPLKAANFGIGGDRTEHVIWRLRNGELEGIQPKLVVLMIGTNNGGDPAENVALGIKTILADIHERSPKSRVLLLGIFPRSEKPDGTRAKNDEVNKLIAKYADGRHVVYLDIGQKFLTPDGTLGKDIMPDFLHPNEKGYQIWADAIVDTVKQMMQADPSKLAPGFTKPSTSPKVAKLEESIAAGKVGAGVKALEKLLDDKDAKTVEAASATLAVIADWKTGIDAEIAKACADGDVFTAAELDAGMEACYTGDIAKSYKDQAAELKKDARYAAGKEYQKLEAIPSDARKDPRFKKMVDAFVKKYPDEYYAKQAEALLPK